MADKNNFLKQLENFNNEAYAISQYVYSDLAVKHAASQSKTLLNCLNMSPRFWLAFSAASQNAAYVSIGRIFDTKSPFNINTLLDSFESNIHLFSKKELAKRKINNLIDQPEWLEEYLANSYVPTLQDVNRLREKVKKHKEVYDRAIKPARNKHIAHREKVDREDVRALYSAGKVKEIWRMVTFLLALHDALWQLYHNGRKPVLKPKRQSIKSIYAAKSKRGDSHEIIVEETKKLMDFLTKSAQQAKKST